MSFASATLDAHGLLAALRGGLAQLERNADLLDALNVFPVPDGDTGSNMVHTLRAGLVALDGRDGAPVSLTALADRLRPRLLAESRGNSGFLVATFLDGFLRDLAEQTTPSATASPARPLARHLPPPSAHPPDPHAARVDPLADTLPPPPQGRLDAARLAHAFEAGAYHATTALANPREGTMLTAMRVMSEALRASTSAAAPLSIAAALTRAVAAGRDAVADTPRLLPVLRRAGVVDAGALGLVLLFDGLRRAILGAAPALEDAAPHRFPPAPEVPAEPMRFRYCTEVVAANPRGLPTTELRAFLASAGDSLAILETDGLIKIHVHTNAPAEVITRAAAFGAIAREKVEDMQAQVDAAAARATAPDETGEVGVLAIVPGPGYVDLFLGLGAARCLVVLDQLPSTADITAALAEISAPRLLILANNNNITPAASLAAQHDPRPAQVVPTGDVTAGTAAMYCFNPAAPLADNLAAMRTAAGLAFGLGVCRAPRASTYGDRSIAAGECFAIRGEQLLAVAPEPAPALLAALAGLDLGGRSVLTLHRGRELDPDSHEAAAAAVRAAWPDLQVEAAEGGQGRYLLWVSIE